MADRAPSLYTRQGDTGMTRLIGRQRVNKDSTRVSVLGEVDELNCQLGVVQSVCDDKQLKDFLQEIQGLLYELSAELAHPANSRLVRAHTARMEQFIDRMSETLPAIDGFILPNGCPAAAQCHLARAVCRRAERNLFRLARTEHVNSASLQFINRLSDLLFVVARTLNQRAGAADIHWKPQNKVHP